MALQAGFSGRTHCSHGSATASALPHRTIRASRVVRLQAEGPSSSGSGGPRLDPEEEDAIARAADSLLKNRYFQQQQQQQQQQPDDGNVLDAVNPYQLGRTARKAFDAAWLGLTQLASPTKSSTFIIDEMLEPGQGPDYEAPQARDTTVLVVGATGRVGKILVRKLLLRGYSVRALVRKREGRGEGEAVPSAVEIVEGDVGNMDDVQAAVRGVDKVIYCAAARSTFTADLLRVEETGVRNVVKALQDEYVRQENRRRASGSAASARPQRAFSDKTKKEIADFSRKYHQLRWDITYVGSPDEASRAAAASGSSGDDDGRRASSSGRSSRTADYFRDAARMNSAVAEINDENNLIFEGALYQRGAVAEVGAELSPMLPGGEHRTANTEGLALRIRGDGNSYACILKTTDGHAYSARFPTRMGYLTVRLPYSVFRAETADSPGLDPQHIHHIALRYDARRTAAATALRAARASSGPVLSPEQQARQNARFELEVDWIKALPGGAEPDFVLVSCAGKTHDTMMEEAELRKVVGYKRRGEDLLRLSGLGYCVIRPGKLVEEPGGYKALVFDQGDRVSESISAADVADICLRALHEPQARNKTFDVCYEYTAAEEEDVFELVAHVPDTRSNYLRAAVAGLQKNT